MRIALALLVVLAGCQATKEQVGSYVTEAVVDHIALKVDENGIALRGVLLRHLVMPDDVAGSAAIMDFLAQEVSADTFLNIMRQYRPSGKVNASNYPEINRPVSNDEYQQAHTAARQAGLLAQNEGRPPVCLREARGHQPEHAQMPVRVGDDDAPE